MCIYLDKPDKKIIMGRSDKCDVKFEDFSVSRKHAILNIKNNGVFI